MSDPTKVSSVRFILRGDSIVRETVLETDLGPQPQIMASGQSSNVLITGMCQAAGHSLWGLISTDRDDKASTRPGMTIYGAIDSLPFNTQFALCTEFNHYHATQEERAAVADEYPLFMTLWGRGGGRGANLVEQKFAWSPVALQQWVDADAQLYFLTYAERQPLQRFAPSTNYIGLVVKGELYCLPYPNTNRDGHLCMGDGYRRDVINPSLDMKPEGCQNISDMWVKSLEDFNSSSMNSDWANDFGDEFFAFNVDGTPYNPGERFALWQYQKLQDLGPIVNRRMTGFSIIPKHLQRYEPETKSVAANIASASVVADEPVRAAQPV